MIVVTYDPEVSENADVGFRIRDGVPTKGELSAFNAKSFNFFC